MIPVAHSNSWNALTWEIKHIPLLREKPLANWFILQNDGFAALLFSKSTWVTDAAATPLIWHRIMQDHTQSLLKTGNKNSSTLN